MIEMNENLGRHKKVEDDDPNGLKLVENKNFLNEAALRISNE